MAFFDVTDPLGRRQLDLTGDLLTFGRLKTSSLQLRDPSCSRSHFEIRRKPDGLWLRDLGSRNKTQINGKAVVAETKLNPGDVIKAGRSKLIYEPPDATRLAPSIPGAGDSRMSGSTTSATATKSEVPAAGRPAPPGPAPVKTSKAASMPSARPEDRSATSPMALPTKAPVAGAAGKPHPAKPVEKAPARPVGAPKAVAGAANPEREIDEATRLAPATPAPLPRKPPSAVAKLAREEGPGVPVPVPVSPKPALKAGPVSGPQSFPAARPDAPQGVDDLVRAFAGDPAAGAPASEKRGEETPLAGTSPVETPPNANPAETPAPGEAAASAPPAGLLPDGDTPPVLKALPREDPNRLDSP